MKREGMSYSEAGKLGAIGVRKFNEREKENKKKIWKEKKGQCKECKKLIPYDKNSRRKVFCNRSCAASFNNKKFPKKTKKWFSTESCCVKCKTSLSSVKNSINCPNNCFRTYRFHKPRKSKKIVKGRCLHCNVEYEKTYLSKFCSRQCFQSFSWADKKIKIITSGTFKEISTPSIKKFLIETSGYRCTICDRSEWMGNKMPLVLDHIDGSSENNKTDNLRLICNNCDMQLSTYKGANRGKGRIRRRERYQKGKSY